MPRCRTDLERLLGLAGQADVVASGEWTPAGVAPMLMVSYNDEGNC